MDPVRPALTTEEWSRHVAALRALARQLVRCEEEREDLVQGTLAAALERPPRVLSFGWLARVLRNRARDLGRRRATRAEERASVELLEADSPTLDQSDVTARLQLATELNQALGALDEPYRSTLYRRYFDGLTPLAIAQREGLPVRTVKSRLERGLALLRERLRRTHGADLGGLLPLLAPLPHVPLPWPLAPASVPAATAETLAGTLLMTKKLAWIALALCGLVGAWWLGSEHDATRSASRKARTAAELALVVPPQRAEFAPLAPEVSGAEGERRAELTSAASTTSAAPLSGLRVTVTWHDGTPAAGVRVELRRRHATLRVPRTPLAAQACDALGVVTFTGLSPGEVYVQAERGGEVEGELAAGELDEVTLRLPPGLELSGRVRDEDGRPLADADVWLLAEAGPYDWLGMAPLARSDAQGLFHARDVPRSRWIGATAAGHAPSELLDLTELDDDASGEVELVLAGGGLDLAGRVVDAGGRAVPDARICVGWITTPRDKFRGARAGAWAPRAARSDAEGRFEFLGLQPGPIQLSTRVAGFAPWSELREYGPGRAREVLVQLAPAASVEGIVRDEAGAPVASACVRVFARAQAPNFLPLGQYDDPDVFGSPFALSDAAGRFHLEDVWSGEVHAYASPPRPGAVLASEFHAEAVLTTHGGSVTRWDPVLGPGRAVRGRLLFSDRAPMGQHFVHLRRSDAADEHERATTCSDDQGRFAFYNLEPVLYRLDVQLMAPPAGALPMGLESLVPDGTELELVASFPSETLVGAGRVTGELVDPSGRCGARLQVSLESDRGVTLYADRFENDAFEFQGLAAGRYRVLGMRENESVAAGPWFELARDGVFDAGRLEVPPAVRLTLHVVRAPTLTEVEVLGALHLAGSPFAGMFELGTKDEITLERGVGLQELRLWGPGVAQVLRRFELDGERTLEVALVPGFVAPIDIDWPAEHTSTTLHVRMTDEHGVVVDDSDLRLQYLPKPFRYGLMLPLGRYTLQATTASGLAGELAFTVESLVEASEVPRLELR